MSLINKELADFKVTVYQIDLLPMAEARGFNTAR